MDVPSEMLPCVSHQLFSETVPEYRDSNGWWKWLCLNLEWSLRSWSGETLETEDSLESSVVASKVVESVGVSTSLSEPMITTPLRSMKSSSSVSNPSASASALL